MDNWLIMILALVVVLALVDGVRRTIVRHREANRTSRNLTRAMYGDAYGGKATREESEWVDPEEARKRAQIARELPGSVRVVQRRALEEALQVNRKVQQGVQPEGAQPVEKTSPAAPDPDREGDEPRQASLNLEEQVPTLMDSVAAGSGDEEIRREPELDESDSLKALSETEQEEQVEPVLKKNRAAEPRPEEASVTSKADRRERRAGGAERPRVDEVLIINIMAPEGDVFEGNDLLRALMAVNMRFGDMDIFHYHLGGGDDGPVIFSLANMVVPGIFELGRMEEFTTPGVSLFLALPVDGEAIKAFELMLSVSREIAEQLGGELKDENRSVFTAQTAEHYRQRVMEFQRRRALARAQA